MTKFNISLKDILYALTLIVGLGIQWGVITTKVSALDEKVGDVSSVKEAIARLSVSAERNYNAIQELQKDVTQVLFRLPPRSK